MMLDDLGLAPTIKRYADTFKEQTGIDISITVSGQERRFESYIEVMIFRALQELLGNAARHSQASMLKVLVDMGGSVVKVNVDDNGKGFDPEILKQGNSLGLNSIRDRVEMLGGTFELDSVVGKGTRVTFTIPAGQA
jgi:two-component system sensor histidine kinase DegS